MTFMNMYVAVLLFSPFVAHSMKLSTSPHKMMLSAVKYNLSNNGTDATEDLAAMGKVFARSVEAQKQSMDAISKSMTLPKALEVLQKSALVNAPFLEEVTGMLNTGRQNLRKKKKDDAFGGLDGARLLLNDMIHEVMVKYDMEIQKCTAYYAQQCALMETARGQISAANFIAASARNLILDSQYNINKCEVAIPETKLELKDHKTQCKQEMKALNARLKIIMTDIAVMTMILEMSDCDAKFLQMKKLALLKCKDQCSNKEYIAFNHKNLQDQVEQLKSPGAKDFMVQTFADLFEDADDDGAVEEGSVELVQVEGSDYMEAVVNQSTSEAQKPKKAKKPKVANVKTEFNNPPVPRTKVPSNPCTSPTQGAPAVSKRGGKCTLKKSPRCYKLQGRFLQIQAEIADARDELMDQIAKKDATCKETQKTLEDAIEGDKSLLESSQTKLAQSMEKESSAGEAGRQVAKENAGYDADLKAEMKVCSTNYADYENELCALRKIRGDLFKKMKPGHPGFFQDCEVTPWSPEACTKVCEGGEQKLTRSVMVKAQGGCKCLPLKADRKCNLHPCPVNCILAQWGGWSKCSSKCGGGLSNRVRDVKMADKYGGTKCSARSEAKPCNMAACEKDCELHPWTAWTTCSKDCDGGTKKRERMILTPAEGSGTCADKWDPTRLNYEKCNNHRCKVADPTKALKCNTSMDVILVIDGTPKHGKDGFKAEMTAVNMFVDAFSGSGITAKPNFAIIYYTGPRTWSGVSKCTGKSSKKVDVEKVCKVKLVTHFTDDQKKVKGMLNGLTFQPGSKLLSLGLMTVKGELAMGDKNHRTVVVVFIDGVPLSYRKTLLASRDIRKKVRLVWVAVTKFAPLKDLKSWASRRWQENLVTPKDIETLAKAETGTHIVANICPNQFPKVKSSMKAIKKSKMSGKR